MDSDTVAKYIVGIVLFVAIIGLFIMVTSINMQTTLTGQVYSVKTKPITCGDETCQTWESENICPEDCTQSEVTGNAIQVKGKSRKWIADAG